MSVCLSVFVEKVSPNRRAYFVFLLFRSLYLRISLSPSLLLTALEVLRMLPVLQRLGDAYSF